MRSSLRLAATITFVALAAPALAAMNMGGPGLGFSCDVNTNSCVCSGTWDGADCKAMAKNCRDAGHTCHETITGVPIDCTCKMAFAKVNKPKLSFGQFDSNGQLMVSP